MSRVLTIAVASALAVACNDPTPPRRGDVLIVSQEQQSTWIRNFNPFLAPGMGRWPSRGGIYEPLMIWSTPQATYVPWLATSYTWSDDARTLRFTLRPGVRFSDGSPLSAEDVVFTFRLLRKHPAADLDGVWLFLDGVEADSADQVVFHFQRPYAPGQLYVAQQPIVPAHVWRGIADPVAFANPTPVATGPFTEIETFENQVYQLGRNPHYWQGPPKVAALRFPAYASNEQANLALLGGEVDWAGNFVPAIDRIYVGENPEHHRYWFPLMDGMIALYPSQAVKPLDDVRVRRALSLALDRELMVQVAMYGYTRPADPTGLDDGYAAWRDPAVSASTWLRHDPAEAERLLDAAGCPRTGPGELRRCGGKPLSLTLQTVSGWSDWVRAAQVIARDLGKVGLDIRVRTYDFAAWFDRLQRGQFELSIAWTETGATPYTFYRAIMASSLRRPVGELSARNWHRFDDPETDKALTAFESTLDPARQRELAAELQRRFVESAPIVPLFPSPSWAEFNTSRIAGFPDASSPYARPTPNRQPECLLVMTRLAPRAAPSPQQARR